MKIHEYQAKQIFRDFGVPVPEGYPAFSVDEAEEAAKKIGGRVVVKAQIHVGGRGKGGGVKLADSPDELREITREMLGKRIIDHNLDEIADDFIAFVREQWLEFWRQ